MSLQQQQQMNGYSPTATTPLIATNPQQNTINKQIEFQKMYGPPQTTNSMTTNHITNTGGVSGANRIPSQYLPPSSIPPSQFVTNVGAAVNNNNFINSNTINNDNNNNNNNNNNGNSNNSSQFQSQPTTTTTTTTTTPLNRHLVNGGESNSSSRNASPALNQSQSRPNVYGQSVTPVPTLQYQLPFKSNAFNQQPNQQQSTNNFISLSQQNLSSTAAINNSSNINNNQNKIINSSIDSKLTNLSSSMQNIALNTNQTIENQSSSTPTINGIVNIDNNNNQINRNIPNFSAQPIIGQQQQPQPQLQLQQHLPQQQQQQPQQQQHLPQQQLIRPGPGPPPPMKQLQNMPDLINPNVTSSSYNNIPPIITNNQYPGVPASFKPAIPTHQHQSQPTPGMFPQQQQQQQQQQQHNQQPQQPQYNQINAMLPPPLQNPSAMGPPTNSITSSNTLNKRPMYPQQVPQPQQQQQLPPQPIMLQQQYQSQQLPLQSQSEQFIQPNLQQPIIPPYQQQQQQPPLQPPPQQLSQQQQQQQSQPIQYQHQSNVFNGQTNAAPLQYQNNRPSITQQGFSKLWGQDTIDLMQNRHILPTTKVKPPSINLNHEFYESVNCSPDIVRCTLTKIPESNSLLQKSRLPLGVLIHPFRDLNNLPVIQCSTIVRCRACRTYINPFVYFVDSKKWKCNLCFRVNELPEEFQYDPVSKSYGDVTRRPEVKSSTIEFIAPSEYMLRPPQPAIYLWLFDVSMIAQQSGYLQTVCNTLLENLDNLPGDARTQIGFIAYNSGVHFYSIADGFSQPHEITIVDIEDIFLPCPDNLLINLHECRELIQDLLKQLPSRFANSHDSCSALGAAIQVAYTMIQQSGGRVTIFQTCLPNVGPGSLQPRENPNDRSSKDVQHLGPATDFYKRLALDCSAQQIAVDMFLLNSQYSDLATLSGISKFSGGCIHHFPLFNISKPQMVESFRKSLERYISRKIGFESVMRVRCTRGLSIHTFHGNFFVRSTDLLSLPNVNPDAGFGMQISYEESLTDSKSVCFQAALLYTSSRGERRIRVHTLCLPVSASLSEIIHSADSQAIIGLISKMAVDRSLQLSISDARDAFINATVDVFSAFKLAQNLPQGSASNGQFFTSNNLSLLPLYMLALLKHIAFRTGTSTRLDDRVFAMCELKTLPLDQLMKYIYPDFYHLDCLFINNNNNDDDAAAAANKNKYDPPIYQLSSERLDSRSVFLLDSGSNLLILVGTNVPVRILNNAFGVQTVNEIPDLCYNLNVLNTPENENLHAFIEQINADKPFSPSIQIIRDTSPYRTMFTEKLIDDRSESTLSYYEFLQHLRTQIK